ncbi:MAG: hypothetical protein J4G09_15855 [Proteobacteria bacterium]|nr:hypothetical protein [Pseudomonadota bacterium]
MEYVSVEEAVELPGLRLVLGPGSPGPWNEAAKAFFRLKGIAFTPVAKPPEGEREGLLRWTRQTSAPVAMYEKERPRSGWAEILFLAERLQPAPALVPEDPYQRALMLGLCFEICGEHGFGWTRRLLILPSDTSGVHDSMPWKYGLEDAAAAAGAAQRLRRILELLARQLDEQRARGRRFLVGENLSALDVCWATFSNMVAPLPHEQSPMPDWLRAVYETPISGVTPPPALLEHRDFVFGEYLGLPQEF